MAVNEVNDVEIQVPRTGRSLAEALRGHDNAFGFLRLLFATLVIVDHSFPLGGFGEDPMWAWSVRQDSLGGIAVTGFFIISGYLITKSSMSCDPLQFLWRRCLRLLPGLWAVLLVTAFFIAPLLWIYENGGLSGYFTFGLGGPFSYVYANAMLEVGQYNIHSLLAETTPYGRSVGASVFNGSLWTLIYEWHCYLVVGALAAFGVFRRYPGFALAFTFGFYLLLGMMVIDPGLPGKLIFWMDDQYTVRYTAVFLMGGMAALYGDRIPLNDVFGVAAIFIYFFSLFNGGYFVLGYPSMVYSILWLAVRLPAAIRNIGSVNDYSYGIYGYGFLVQQVLARFHAETLGLFSYMFFATAISAIFAYGSWHLVEKRAMTLKGWGPGRGLPDTMRSVFPGVSQNR